VLIGSILNPKEERVGEDEKQICSIVIDKKKLKVITIWMINVEAYDFWCLYIKINNYLKNRWFSTLHLIFENSDFHFASIKMICIMVRKWN